MGTVRVPLQIGDSAKAPGNRQGGWHALGYKQHGWLTIGSRFADTCKQPWRATSWETTAACSNVDAQVSDTDDITRCARKRKHASFQGFHSIP
jgi:hypothetical protein